MWGFRAKEGRAFLPYFLTFLSSFMGNDSDDTGGRTSQVKGSVPLYERGKAKFSDT